MVLNVQDFAYDIGIFAGLGLGMYAMNQLLGQRLSDTNVLEGHPSIQRSPFVRPVLQVHELQQPALFAELLGMLDRFLTVIDLDLLNYGFETIQIVIDSFFGKSIFTFSYVDPYGGNSSTYGIVLRQSFNNRFGP